ncbi:MAG: putative lipid II flippase FtsW [Dehalococcoidia bacterium]|nr:putative lipid II flippase FtsW [Dehalococcoidia bacterium]
MATATVHNTSAGVRRGAPADPVATTGHYDWVLLGFVAVLVMVGLEVVFSATFALSITEGDHAAHYLILQGQWALLGFGLMFITARIPYGVWRFLSPLMVVGAVVVLLLVLIPGLGVSSYGAARWLKLGPLPAIQPSEFVKLAVIIGVATWLSGPRERRTSLFKGILPLMLFLGVVAFLIMKEPDMGTTLVVMLTATTMMFLAGVGLHYLTAIAAGGIALGMMLITSGGYRSDRLQSFLDPWSDPSGLGFHIIQLLIAMGSGGLFGLGPGASRQKFFYVPSAQADGIFAILGEEVGFVGCVVVLLLFAAVVYRGTRIAQRAPDRFGALLAMGIVCWIAYQTLINVAGITRTFPLTGIPIPFLSYGGSSLAATLVAIGILLNVSRAGAPPTKAPRGEG